MAHDIQSRDGGGAVLGPALAAAFIDSLGGSPGSPSPDQDAFLARVLSDYRPGELPLVGPADLGAALGRFWAFAAGQGAKEPAVRLVRAVGADDRDLEADLLEIVQPDAPFLVDSVMGEVTDQGGEILAMFHPLVGEGEARRSMIQVWIAPVALDRRARLVNGVLDTLRDVHTAVRDFPEMLALMARSIGELMRAAPGDQAALTEQIEFLRWMDSGNFVFLGARPYEFPRTPDGGYAAEEPTFQPEDGLGVLRDPERLVLRRAFEPVVLSASLRRRRLEGDPVIVAKSNLRSKVHRRVLMDYVGVRRYGPDGKPSGEVRFVGLFAAEAYNQPARVTPLLRHKVGRVMAAAGFPPGSHNATRLANILETFPRDELFQVDASELLPLALDVLHLSDRPRVKLFVRRDPFDRFVSVLFYAPRERYDDRLRERAGEILALGFGGRIASYYPSYTEAPLARVHYIVDTSAGANRAPDLAVLEAELARAARTWGDDLEAVVRDAITDPDRAGALFDIWGGAFPPGYRDRYDAAEAMRDIHAIETLGPGEAVAVRAFRDALDLPTNFRFKLYRRGQAPAPLSRVLPILADMGLSALVEDGYPLDPRGEGLLGEEVWVHEFEVRDDAGERLTFADVKAVFESGLIAVWDGRAECDGFNRMVLELGVSWRDAALLRALARYRGQSGLDPSQKVQEEALAAHPHVARLILRLFATRFDPASEATLEARAIRAASLGEEIDIALRDVESLDHDRVLRRLAALVQAITRTNYYQPGLDGEPKAHISFKLASRELADLPAPRPYREIFVASPLVEGVHLRFGPVARGGLRWSDRRDDFRTEVLGLVKAQQVKNAVIVPVGSKGGFYPKQLPRGGTPAETRAAAVRAYRVFLNGLLDLTDNLDAEGQVIPPADVVIHDGEDPYLVVAADKGTATFSDIANGVAADYGFWLGDAFASGGSVGYDHKAMGITARGAWESVKRHFRELGKDIQTEPFTVVGVGDMSGDVFGNGMLLSKAIRLRAAFDHRHIFVDPDPDPAVSWGERKRLFDLPASSWESYDAALISPGGGVWSRSAKSIPVSEAMAALLDLKAGHVSPFDLMSAILKSRTELLYLGGIGTYVKASTETHAQAGDKANDAIRVNGRDLRCRVVGEGANLGFTQAGRIEFALAGGRLNSDAIDNSAGVDTSDHEVNIKILVGMAERAGALAAGERNPLLATLTDEIAEHVLAHNYDQTLQLSLQEAGGLSDVEAQDHFMSGLESRGRLDRALEGLPTPAVLAERAKAGKGLTRPERAVLLAYGKLELFDAIIASAAPDDPVFETALRDYFPRPLWRFEDQMRRHRLRREIIATTLANDIVNLLGPTFAGRLMTGTGCDAAGLVIAFEAARRTLGFAADWARVSELDGQVHAAAQTALYLELAHVLRGQTYWFARRAGRETAGVQGLIDRYKPAVDVLRGLIPGVLSPFERKAAVRRSADWIRLGAPKTLAHSLGLLRPLTYAADLGDLAARAAWPLDNAAHVYHRVGGHFGFDRLREAAAARTTADPYERVAIRRLIEDILAEQADLAAAVMAAAGPPEAGEPPEKSAAAVAAWSAARARAVKVARDTVAEIEGSPGGWTFAKLTIANASLRTLSAA